MKCSSCHFLIWYTLRVERNSYLHARSLVYAKAVTDLPLYPTDATFFTQHGQDLHNIVDDAQRAMGQEEAGMVSTGYGGVQLGSVQLLCVCCVCLFVCLSVCLSLYMWGEGRGRKRSVLGVILSNWSQCNSCVSKCVCVHALCCLCVCMCCVVCVCVHACVWGFNVSRLSICSSYFLSVVILIDVLVHMLGNWNVNLLTNADLSVSRFVAGVIPREKVPGFERLLWFACRGNVFLRHEEIYQPLEDPMSVSVLGLSCFLCLLFFTHRSRRRPQNH